MLFLGNPIAQRLFGFAFISDFGVTSSSIRRRDARFQVEITIIGIHRQDREKEISADHYCIPFCNLPALGQAKADQVEGADRNRDGIAYRRQTRCPGWTPSPRPAACCRPQHAHRSQPSSHCLSSPGISPPNSGQQYQRTIPATRRPIGQSAPSPALTPSTRPHGFPRAQHATLGGKDNALPPGTASPNQRNRG